MEYPDDDAVGAVEVFAVMSESYGNTSGNAELNCQSAILHRRHTHLRMGVVAFLRRNFPYSIW
jgi:hypothetical protein